MDKYLVIWWNNSIQKSFISKPVTHEEAFNIVNAITKGKPFYFNGDDKKYELKEWSVVITEYRPILEKDLWNEL